MDYLGSPNNLNDQDMIPIYQLGGNTRTAITSQLSPVEREPPLRGPQLIPQMEALTSRLQQVMAGTAGQQLQFQNDVIVNVDGLLDRTNHQLMRAVAGTAAQQLQFPNDVIVSMDDQGITEYNPGRVEDLTLGQNQSDPILWLRLNAIYSIAAATVIGVVVLPRDLHGVHDTYQRAQLVATVGAPIAVAVSSLLASFRFASHPEGWSNWITVLSRVNAGMIGGGPLVFYLMSYHAAGN